MKKYFSALLVVVFFALCPALQAQNIPVNLAEGLVKNGAKGAASQVALDAVKSAIAAQVTKQAASTAAVPVCSSNLQTLCAPNLSSAQKIIPLRVYTQAKILLGKNERFSGDAATDKALARMRGAQDTAQVEEIIALSNLYPCLVDLSGNGMFTKFKYVGPEPSGVPVILAKDFTIMLEGPLDLTLIEKTLSVHQQVVVEEGDIGNLKGTILRVKSGSAQHLKEAVAGVVQEMQTLGFKLRLGVHEVNNFVGTGKVHLHFEKFDNEGIFHNYIIYVDLVNIRLPYDPLGLDKNLTIGRALKKADDISLYGYAALAETRNVILKTMTDILPIEQGSEAYERLSNSVMM